MATMPLMRSPVFRQQLTQMFADNKKACENVYDSVAQTPPDGPEYSALQLELRIQKDRFLAWGIQWRDQSNSSDSEDIDGSLTRAGIHESVKTVMSTIKGLLEHVDHLQPQMSGRLPSMLPEPSLSAKMPEPRWTIYQLKQLENVVKTFTICVDALCELSNQHLEGAKKKASSPPVSPSVKTKSPAYPKFVLNSTRVPVAIARTDDVVDDPESLTNMAFISSRYLEFQPLPSHEPMMPPSYDSIAVGYGDRVLADYFPPRSGDSTRHAPKISVLLDYGKSSSAKPMNTPCPANSRFEELLLGLLKAISAQSSPYTGFLKLLGWTKDIRKQTFAYVYEMPSLEATSNPVTSALQPLSLRSSLQQSGDLDTSYIPNLEDRFRLAVNLSSTIGKLHELGIYHRNIDSNNVLFFTNSNAALQPAVSQKGPMIRKPFLAGFDQTVEELSNDSDNALNWSWYLHPELITRRARYKIQHEYYSLGLLLLEIGLWMPVSKFWKQRYSPETFKKRLQDVYLKKLASKCGSTYMKAALYCMSLAENPETSNFSNEQIISEIREHVLNPLKRCCLIEDTPTDSVDSRPTDTASTPQYQGMARASASQPNLHSTLAPPNSQSKAQIRQEMDAVKADISTTATNPAESSAVQRLRKPAVSQARKCRVWSHEIPSLYSKYWSSTMFPKLERILTKAISRWESYSVDLFMAGEDAETARPTIYMECKSTAKIRKILRHLNKDLRLFEIKVVQGEIVRSKAGKKKRKSTTKGEMTATFQGQSSTSSNDNDASVNPHYQHTPGHGASIGAYLEGNHLPPVSFGGTVKLNGELYGMSVHHMLEDDEAVDTGDMERSMASRHDPLEPFDPTASIGSSTTGLYPYDVDYYENDSTNSSAASYLSQPVGREPPELIPSRDVYPYELSEDDFDADYSERGDDDEDDEFWLRDDWEKTIDIEGDESDPDLGDTLGIQPGDGEELLVTQPAFDDVPETYFPSKDDACDDHLTSHTLGHIHASSGLRRARQDDLIHEIDWALIKIQAGRKPVTKIDSRNQPSRKSKQGAGQYNGHDLRYANPTPLSIVPCGKLGGLNVRCTGRTSGVGTGTILPNMRMVRMPGRAFASHSWQVKGDFGSGGDSGAWVLDAETGAVCGHVLAHSEGSGVTYIAPMDVLVQDIQDVCGGNVQVDLLSTSDMNEPLSLQKQRLEKAHGQNAFRLEDDASADAVEVPSRSMRPALPDSAIFASHTLTHTSELQNTKEVALEDGNDDHYGKEGEENNNVNGVRRQHGKDMDECHLSARVKGARSKASQLLAPALRASWRVKS